MEELVQDRREMVELQLAARGIRDSAVLRAMGQVPREEFVPAHLVEYAYADAPLPIGRGQTISQPYVVALMTEALELELDERVLEIGTGSGYAAAVLSRIAKEVYTVERHSNLARSAEEHFQRLGYDNIHVHIDDGTLGWPEHSPYDGIVVTAGGPEIPDPLLKQLAIGGRLVIPVGARRTAQQLLRLSRTSQEDYKREELGHVRFVPLVGEAGWQPG
ncbi:MAG: protein-L-isoaspartate(D-aspartate) O-methyltransferase [Chloroflexota bacterium]|jgi:protein-L-isoaspartate(D-aspartate) O-methyltransferase